MGLLARPQVRWTALIVLWGLVVAVVWILAVQVFLVLLNPFCQARRPGVAQVVVRSIDADPNSQITDFVTVRQGETDRVLRMSKHEAADLRPEDEVWVLDTWYEDNLRPTQFRLTPLRILLDYPFLLLLPAGLALWRLRRARQQAEAAPPPPVRRTFTDDFHLRAQRFAKPQPPEGPGSPPPDAP